MAVQHWVKRGYSCSVQQGVNRRGRLRADVVAMNLRGEIVIVEVKSCRADHINDHKWEQYRPYCDQFFFAWPSDLSIPLDKGIGLLLPDGRGHLCHARSASVNKMDGATRRTLIIRLAWRAGQFNKSNTRRTRVYLE